MSPLRSRAAAFTEKNVDRLLDIGVSVIPQDSLIAQVHREVRAWCREDGDWHRTYERIAAKYGYDKFGGGCHMIPNHALMVMAWAYAEGSFRRSQAIINTAGWDTDCNAANVGSVMGLVVGLEGINREYDFQAPCTQVASGRLLIDRITITGSPNIHFPGGPTRNEHGSLG